MILKHERGKLNILSYLIGYAKILLMKFDKEALLKHDYLSIFRSPYISHYLGALFVAISAFIAISLPKDSFLIAPGILGNKWGLVGIIAVLLAVMAINFFASVIIFSRDKVLFWILSTTSAVVAFGVLVKVASVAYFW